MGWGSLLLSPWVGACVPKVCLWVNAHTILLFGARNQHPIGILHRQLDMEGFGGGWDLGMRSEARSPVLSSDACFSRVGLGSYSHNPSCSLR